MELFLQQRLMAKSRWLFWQKSSITDVWQGLQYISEELVESNNLVEVWSLPCLDKKTFSKVAIRWYCHLLGQQKVEGLKWIMVLDRVSEIN